MEGENRSKILRRKFLQGSLALSVFPTELLAGQKKSEKLGTESVLFRDPAQAQKAFSNSEDFDVYLRTTKPNFLNIGVTHSKDVLKSQLTNTPLGLAINDADIVLLEHGPADGYFHLLKQAAEAHGAKVQLIDRSHNEVSETIGGGVDVTVLKRLYDLFVLVKKGEANPSTLIKQILATYGISNFGYYVPMFLEFSVNKVLSEGLSVATEGHDIRSVSHMIDGRNIFMTLDVMQVIADNPDKKILAITGDIHATAINKYLTTNEGEREIKSFLYNLMYGWLKLFESKLV